jgi:hypothetical protein
MADAPPTGAAPGAADTPPPGSPAPASGTPPPEAFDWKSHIPEDLRGEKVWEDVKDFPTLAKRFVDNHKYNVGALKLPPANARPEAWAEVYNKLGRPESPEGYEITPPPLPEGVTFDETEAKGFYQHAHTLGLTTRQVQGVMEYYGDYTARLLERSQHQTRSTAEHTLDGLRQEFGPVTFDRQLRTVEAFVRAEGDPELWSELEATGWGNHPQLTRLMMRLAEDWKADQIAAGMKEEDFTGMPSPQAAGEEAKKLMADMRGPYWQRNHPLHQETRDKVARLMEIAYPNQRRPE